MDNVEAVRAQIENLKQSMNRADLRFSEIAHITTFKGYRTTKEGTEEPITIEIRDRGPNAGEYRYTCHARADSGRTATGNGGPTIKIALETTHWAELDR